MAGKIKLDVLPKFIVGTQERKLKLFLTNPAREWKWQWNNDAHIEIPTYKDDIEGKAKFALHMEVETYIHFKTPNCDKIFNDAIKCIEDKNKTQLANNQDEIDYDFEKFKEKFDAEFAELGHKLNSEDEEYKKQKQKQCEEKKIELNSDKATSEYVENVCNGQIPPLFVSFEIADKSTLMFLTNNKDEKSVKTPIGKFGKPPSERVAWNKLKEHLEAIPGMAYNPEDLKRQMNNALTDISRKYTDAADAKSIKQQHNQQQSQQQKSDGYCEYEGRIGYKKIRTDKETGEERIIFDEKGNFTFEFLKEIHKEDGTIEYETNIKCIKDENEPRKFTVDTKTLSDNKLLAIAIRNACPKAVFDTKDVAGISQCFDVIKKDAKIPIIKKVTMGWHDDEYVMKSIIITKDGIKENDKYLIDVPASSKARFIDMFEIKDEQFIECGKHITTDLLNLHDPYFVRMAIADAYGAPFQRRLEETGVDEIRYPKIDKGTPQAGKSYLERLTVANFGIIPEDGGFVTWGSTTYAVEAEGGNYRDVLFLADDLSKDLLNNESEKVKFHRMLHNYTSGAGRDRLKQSGEQKAARPMSGLFIVTAENTVTEGASNAGRVCYVPVPEPTEEQKAQYRIHGERCQAMKQYYPGFMARYIADVVKNENWLNDYKAVFIRTRDEFLQTSGSDRAVKMHAIRYVHFEMFCNFMNKNGFMTESEKAIHLSELKQRMLVQIENTAESIKSERHSTVILDKMQQLIASGTLTVAQRHDNFVESHNKNPIAVVLDDMNDPDGAYIIPDVVIQQLKRHMKESDKIFQVDKDDIGKELKANGYLKDSDVDIVDGKEKPRNTKRFRFNGGNPRGWHIYRRLIGIPDAVPESQVSLFDIAQWAMLSFEDIGVKDTPPTPKQYNMVINNLLDQFRPGVSKADKHRMWDELEPMVRLVCYGKGWVITSKAEGKDKTEAEKDAAEIKKNNPQSALLGIPPAGNQKVQSFDLTSM